MWVGDGAGLVPGSWKVQISGCTVIKCTSVLWIKSTQLGRVISVQRHSAFSESDPPVFWQSEGEVRGGMVLCTTLSSMLSASTFLAPVLSAPMPPLCAFQDTALSLGLVQSFP